MATAKKKVAKNKVAKKKPLTNNKLHAVLGDDLMVKYEAQCAKVGSGMTKSEVARLLAESFANGGIVITPPKVAQKKAIKA